MDVQWGNLWNDPQVGLGSPKVSSKMLQGRVRSVVESSVVLRSSKRNNLDSDLVLERRISFLLLKEPWNGPQSMMSGPFSGLSDLCILTCAWWVGLRQGCAESPIVFVVFTDRILGCSRGEERIQFRLLKILPLVFPDDVVLMAPSTPQHTLGRFTAECEAAGIRSSTSKCRAMVISRNPMNCLLMSPCSKWRSLGVSCWRVREWST